MNVSVLGCVVNGIGEGKEPTSVLPAAERDSVQGKLVRKVPIDELMDTLIHEVDYLPRRRKPRRTGSCCSPFNEGWKPAWSGLDPWQRDPRPF
jgi:(E)-4-hydroxy-3-methylbut-2-enyl-diphosphate synthase